jgi:hypothetical protein
MRLLQQPRFRLANFWDALLNKKTSWFLPQFAIRRMAKEIKIKFNQYSVIVYLIPNSLLPELK